VAATAVIHVGVALCIIISFTRTIFELLRSFSAIDSTSPRCASLLIMTTTFHVGLFVGEHMAVFNPFGAYIRFV